MKKVVKKILFGMILVLVLFLVGCGGEETIKADPTPSDDTSVVAAVPAAGNENVKEMVVEQNDDATEEETEETTEEPTSTVKEFDIEANNWDFSPSTIRVNQGDIVKLHVKTTEGKHGILIPGFGVNKPLNPGEDVDIEFLADKKGTFPMICSVFCGHGHSDMKGSLIVE